MDDSDESDTDTPRLKFADEFVEPILAGRKAATIRYGLEYDDFHIGRRFHLCDEDGERFASAIVDDRGYTTVEMAAGMDFNGHRSYQAPESLVEELRDYYPDEDIDVNTRVEIVYWDWDELWE